MDRPQPGQLGHTCIRVKNADATIQFYHELLGMPVVERRGEPGTGSGMAALGAQANYLEVFEIKPDAPVADVDPRALRLNHFCLWVEGIEELQPRAEAAGHPFLNPIRALANWVGASIKVGWLLDPDGNRVELLEWVGPAEG
jgi:catechol 2,3-dioxygenase-like lactoylglutathione lyase family enzyme